MPRIPVVLITSLLVLTSLAAHAENSTRVGDYTIHHNAVTTDYLSPEVASAYRIQRSKNRAMLNISIIKNKAGTTGTPVSARVGAIARNLYGQARTIPLEEIREGDAIYYIGEFPIVHRDQLIFDIEVVPEDSNYPLRAHFRKTFYTQ